VNAGLQLSSVIRQLHTATRGPASTRRFLKPDLNIVNDKLCSLSKFYCVLPGNLGTEGKHEVHERMERFLEFVDCNRKTGEAIAQLIIETLEKHGIPLSNCRGQGYDNGSNMSGSYKGAQAFILKQNPLATFAPCACHSLNLCGVIAAECCPQ